LFKSYLNRLFWGLYGGVAWDDVQLPIKKKMVACVVRTLRDKQASPGEKVLDTGCGTGNYALALAGEGFHVTGIDYSPGMLECAKSKVTHECADRLVFRQMDMNKPLEFSDDSFDHVISMTSLWTVADPGFTLSEFTRVLKPGGSLIVMQIPKPVGSLKKTISTRFKHLEKKTPVIMALVAVKVFLERTGATKYWSPEELLALLLCNKGLAVSYVDHGPPIFVVASKKHVTQPRCTDTVSLPASSAC